MKEPQKISIEQRGAVPELDALPAKVDALKRLQAETAADQRTERKKACYRFCNVF